MPTPIRPKAYRKPTQKKIILDEHFKTQTNVITDESVEIMDIETPNRKRILDDSNSPTAIATPPPKRANPTVETRD